MKALRWARKSWPLVVVVIATLVGVGLLPVFTRPPSDLGVQAKPRIKQVIYPTFGNPAIIKKGNTLTIEYDPRNRKFTRRFKKVQSFVVSVNTSNGACPVTMGLPVLSTRVGTSTRWPEYAAGKLLDRNIYLVTVEVPTALPGDLYDLTVTGKLNEKEAIIDTQPHSLQAVEEYKDTFSFVQLTDIHIWGPECSFGSAVYHDREARPTGPAVTGKGAVYYEKAINQINVMKPDFCVFTGDYMYGQAYLLQDQGAPWGLTTEYEYEMSWFYDETMKLDVPVFLTPGNHDSFAEGDGGAHEDWFENWRRLFGPLYHSFDYGDYHFLALNAQDWPIGERTLVDYDVSIQSEKYKGQFSGGGDKWAPGVTEARLKKIDKSKLSGQLKWMLDDLAAHQGSKMRVVATHQDPWRKQGSGQMWASQGADSAGFFGSIKSAMGFGGKYGNGDGRLAAIKLMAENKVALELSGHFHSDFLETFPWPDGTGQLVSANTTCTQFNVDGPSRSYPGYRRIWVSDGKLVSVNYAEPSWSYPIYAGTNVGGLTDLTKLEVPAIDTAWTEAPGAVTDITVTVKNALAKPVPDASVEIPMPYLAGSQYYKVNGGTLGQARDGTDAKTGQAQRVLEVSMSVPSGQSRAVHVVVGAQPDTEAPSGTVAINNGAVLTATRDVTLSMNASDAGGSGLKDMMISNRDDFNGANWEPYRPVVAWRLADGAPGRRVVYVKFRDYAMPENVSAVAAASIDYISVSI
ncbi:MAG: metallophosphoesterase family protein [Candidatus Geothermincolia bacterium]